MELDDFKKEKITSVNDEVKFDQLKINSLKAMIQADFKKQKRTAVHFTAVLIGLAFIYLSVYERGNFIMNLGLSFLSIGLCLGAIYVYFKSRQLNDSIYCLPLTEFLSAAEKRLEYMKISDWLIVIPLLLLLGTGGGIAFITRLLKYTDNIILLIIIWTVFFTGLSIFGSWAGRKDWVKGHGALLDEVKKLKKTLLEDMDK
jgi:hypothetical protein